MDFQLQLFYLFTALSRYVLTYIPDLKWCHLVPMEEQGVFGPERKRSHGRPRYRLVDEKLALELDISSTYCIAVKARALKKSNDADKEEWDIIDDGQPPSAAKPARRVISEGNEKSKSSTKKKPASVSNEAASSAATASGSITSYFPNPALSSCVGSPTRRAPPQKTPRFHVVLSPSTAQKSKKAESTVQPNLFRGDKTITNSTLQGTTIHTRDPFKRTRSSPVSEAAAVSLDDRYFSPPSKSRQKHVRRCMRCVENGGSHAQASSCNGRKGRLGRNYCEFFDSNGKRIKAFEEPESPQRTTPSGRKPRRCVRCIENGTTEEQATECPGAKGRLGQKACIHFPPQDEQQPAVDDQMKTVLFPDEAPLDVMIDTTNRKRKSTTIEESDAIDPEIHARKSLRSSAPVSYIE